MVHDNDMIPYCPFQTPSEVCFEISNVADQKQCRLFSRPYRIHEPEISSWWLVPSSSWPAFKFGKFYFSWGENNTLLCGLHVEEGIDPNVRSGYPSEKGRRYIMTPNWTWYRFLSDLNNQKLESIIKIVAESLSFPIEFSIDGGYVIDPDSFDPYGLRIGWDSYQLIWQKNSNKFKTKKVKQRANLLNELIYVKTFNNLYQVLEKLGKDDWIWLNVYISIGFRIEQDKNKVSETNHLWSANDIWEKFLCHFLPWLM